MIDESDAAAYAADAAVDPQAATNILALITETARDLRQAEADVLEAQKALEDAQNKVRVLKEMRLPELMAEAKQDLLRTTDGFELKKEEVVRASLPASNPWPGIAWLRANQQDSIIKRDVKVQFGKGQDQKAAEVVDKLVELGCVPEDKQSVHPMTLSSVVRELMKDGVDVPFDILGVHIQQTVKMKDLNKAKGK